MTSAFQTTASSRNASDTTSGFLHAASSSIEICLGDNDYLLSGRRTLCTRLATCLTLDSEPRSFNAASGNRAVARCDCYFNSCMQTGTWIDRNRQFSDVLKKRLSRRAARNRPAGFRTFLREGAALTRAEVALIPQYLTDASPAPRLFPRRSAPQARGQHRESHGGRP